MRTPAPQNLIETEARNHFALFRTQTPLLGGQNIELQGEGTGFGGVKPNMLKVGFMFIGLLCGDVLI